MKIEGVNVFGPVEVASGLGTAVRGHLRAMWAAGLRTRVFPFRLSPRQGTQKFEYPQENQFFDVSVVYANPDATDLVESLYGREIQRAKLKIGVWVWELPAAREEHIPYTRHYDEIWVPSIFNQRAFSAVTKTPVYVVPYVVAPMASSGASFRTRLGIGRDNFVFLYMFDASSYVERKNPQVLIRAFQTISGSDSPAKLVLKVAHLDDKARFAIELSEAQKTCPNLRVLRETLDERELAALIGESDCYVSPHRTEGFGLTLAEAMAMSKPVIATDYGSTRDFLNTERGYPIAYRLVEIGADLGPYPSGAVWADPSEAELATTMKHVMSHRDERATRGAAARDHVLRSLSISSIAGSIAARLADLTNGRRDTKREACHA